MKSNDTPEGIACLRETPQAEGRGGSRTASGKMSACSGMQRSMDIPKTICKLNSIFIITQSEMKGSMYKASNL